MNREIKFRAWDGTKMQNSDEFSDIRDKNEIFRLSRFFASLTFHKDWSHMQYTGLKDKNGKDVFEGDNLYVVDDVVVETIGGYPRTEPEGRTETVTYERGAFWWGEELLWEVASHGEVISNIYENEGSEK